MPKWFTEYMAENAAINPYTIAILPLPISLSLTHFCSCMLAKIYPIMV